MKHQTQIELTRAVFHHLANGTTDRAAEIYQNPVAHYTSAERLVREKTELFLGRPLMMALTCQLREPGAFITCDGAGVPVLLTRGEDGVVRAFLNVCRHRGARVAMGCGVNHNRFQCPYHGWTYDSAGYLVAVPDKHSFEGVDRSEHRLVSLPAVERNGLIWVHATPSGTDVDAMSIDIDRTLAGLGTELQSFNIDTFHHHTSRQLRQKMNWKLVVDTFLESYHFGILHRHSIAPIFFNNLCLFQAFGPHLRVIYPRRSIEALRDRPESEWDLVHHSAMVYVLFPNTVFVVQADHFEVWRIFPVEDKVDETVIFLDFFVPEPATSQSAIDHWDRNLELVTGVVSDEDFPTGEGIQFGFLSGAQSHVTYGRNEPALAHFENTVTVSLEQ